MKTIFLLIFLYFNFGHIWKFENFVTLKSSIKLMKFLLKINFYRFLTKIKIDLLFIKKRNRLNIHRKYKLFHL